MRVQRVFITHFHGDHFLGLPGLIQSMCLNNRTEPLEVYGPHDAKEMVDRVLALGYFTQRFPVSVHPLAPGDSVELNGYTIRTALATHPVPALAYRLDEGPKRGRFDPVKAKELGIRGPDFSRLESGRRLVDDAPFTPRISLVHPAKVDPSSIPAIRPPRKRFESSPPRRLSLFTKRRLPPRWNRRRINGGIRRPGKPRRLLSKPTLLCSSSRTFLPGTRRSLRWRPRRGPDFHARRPRAICSIT